ncbi:hypothetical protein K3172_05505 [Qipengyuania sp. 6B39]|uniref:hypothetical protein n=1 Tax=Qipengyuania proteolytica TaxID=2867239 RepID=UPI001C8A5D9B|nr:hypothetical protein [Qipengyuania proteolytica]MBX7495308.1 hypothetical protein [Qipengyuania proteolytica]
MVRTFALVSTLALAACKPPASDDYAERTRLAPAVKAPSDPIDSPDVEGAVWAPTDNADRLLYGKPGERPLFALECIEQGGLPLVTYTRFAVADAHAKAVLALIGNGHVSRLKIDAAENGGAWRWEGTIEALDPKLDVLTGQREVEATVPGAGTLRFNPSARPGELVERCRAMAAPEPKPEPNVSETPAPSRPEDPA